jgi:hypothetical protein
MVEYLVDMIRGIRYIIGCAKEDAGKHGRVKNA